MWQRRAGGAEAGAGAGAWEDGSIVVTGYRIGWDPLCRDGPRAPCCGSPVFERRRRWLSWFGVRSGRSGGSGNSSSSGGSGGSGASVDSGYSGVWDDPGGWNDSGSSSGLSWSGQGAGRLPRIARRGAVHEAGRLGPDLRSILFETLRLGVRYNADLREAGCSDGRRGRAYITSPVHR